MPMCPMCGLSTFLGEMCSHHGIGEIDWHIANKTWCDLIHRGIQPQRLPEREREQLQEEVLCGIE